MRARATFGAVGWCRLLKKSLLHSVSVPSSCALLGSNLPDIWIPEKNTFPDTHFSERHHCELKAFNLLLCFDHYS